MQIQTSKFSAGGKTFTGYFACDETRTQARPGVLVLHEGSGLSDHTKQRADMLANLGYVAFAPDLFGEKFQSREHGAAVINNLVQQPSVLRERLSAAARVLQTRVDVDPDRLAVIGFCFGGLAALEFARSGANLACAVSFHGSLKAVEPAQSGRVKCKLLVCTGADDPFVSRDERGAFEDEMTRAGADWQLIVYSGARHGFTNRNVDPSRSPGSAYHEPTDRRSWQAMRTLFQETMGAV